MNKFFSRNLSNRGRLVRGVGGLLLIGAGLALSGPGQWICFALVASGGFVLFEAVRGWCMLRACGIRTRI